MGVEEAQVHEDHRHAHRRQLPREREPVAQLVVRVGRQREALRQRIPPGRCIGQGAANASEVVAVRRPAPVVAKFAQVRLGLHEDQPFAIANARPAGQVPIRRVGPSPLSQPPIGQGIPHHLADLVEALAFHRELATGCTTRVRSSNFV